MIVNVHEAKTDLSRLLVRAEQGEEVIIARAGTPVVRFVPVASGGRARIPGGARGEFRVPDDFDAPLPDDLLAAFEGRADAEADPKR